MPGYRILIVDDDPLQRELLREYLELSGFSVDEAENGRLGLARVNQQRPDLVILDLQMPVMDGFSTLSALQADPETATIPALLLTSHDRPNLKVKGLELGAEDYITKPFHQAELLARVKAALRRTGRYRERAGRLSGDLESMNLFDLLSTLELGGRSARIELPKLDASIDLSAGRFQDASFFGATGPGALVRIFLAARGGFSVQFRGSTNERGPEGRSVSGLLLDAARRLDEWTREVPELADSSRWFERAAALPAPAADFPPLPLTAAGILARWPGEPDDGLPILRRLIDDGTLVPLATSHERSTP